MRHKSGSEINAPVSTLNCAKRIGSVMFGPPPPLGISAQSVTLAKQDAVPLGGVQHKESLHAGVQLVLGVNGFGGVPFCNSNDNARFALLNEAMAIIPPVHAFAS